MNNYNNQDCMDLIVKEFNKDPNLLGNSEITLYEYLEKIDKNAVFEKYFANNNLAGFLAYYCNNIETKQAFLTLLLVDEDYRGMGVAQELMNRVKNIAKQKGFTRINLQVSLYNPNGIKLHKKLGYLEEYRDKDSIFMYLNV